MVDVGALDVNGTVRELFKDAKYVGVDMRPGPNVDVVLNGHELSTYFPEDSVDCIVCFDTLEHDIKFWETVYEMRKILRPQGWLLIGVPSFNHGRHEHPSDYYRFLDTALEQFMFNGFINVQVWLGIWTTRTHSSNEATSNNPDQIFGWGQKP